MARFRENVLQALSTADEATLTAVAAHPTESIEEVRVRLGIEERPGSAGRSRDA